MHGLVAGNVKLDDLGLYMSHKTYADEFQKRLDDGIIAATPILMKTLFVVDAICSRRYL